MTKLTDAERKLKEYESCLNQTLNLLKWSYNEPDKRLILKENIERALNRD